MIKTLIALRKSITQKRFDKSRLRLIVEDAETMDTFTVRAVEMDAENSQAGIVVEKVKE